MDALIDTSVDGHVHTRLCRHARGEMEEYVQAALKRNLRSLIFLEHLEAGIKNQPRTWLEAGDFSYYFQEGKRLQNKYQGQVAILLGVEVGYNPEALDLIQDTLSRYPVQWLGLSYHFFRSEGHHLNLLSKKQANIDRLQAQDTSRILDEYFTGLEKAAKILRPDVLCHMDAALRHCPGIVLSQRNMDQVETLLTTMQQENIALEVNTSGFVYRGEPFPGQAIIRSALRRNIQLRPGSDAHHPDQVGRYFDRLPALVHHIQQQL